MGGLEDRDAEGDNEKFTTPVVSSVTGRLKAGRLSPCPATAGICHGWIDGVQECGDVGRK